MKESAQARVASFIEEHNLQAAASVRLLDLTSEVGELAKAYLRASEYGGMQFIPSDNWMEELGDVYFSLLCLANQTDVELETALDAALEKYQRRIDQRGVADSGS